MRKLTLTLLAGVGALIASNANAADEIQIGASSPLPHQARLVCNDAGQCWHTRCSSCDHWGQKHLAF